jgi:peptidoglycan/LPS O-acetylase OafA/YrhL
MVRIYPAFWVAVTITATVTVTLGRGLFTVTPIQYVANLTLANSLPNIAGMALCTIYRTGFSWTLGVILVLAYGNAVYRAIGFAHVVSARLDQALPLPASLTIITLIFVVMALIAFRLTRRFGRPHGRRGVPGPPSRRDPARRLRPRAGLPAAAGIPE